MHIHRNAKQTAVIGRHISSTSRSIRGGWLSFPLVAMILCLQLLALEAQEKPDSSPTKAEVKVIVLQPVIQFEALQANVPARARHTSSSEDFEGKLLVTATETLTLRKFTAVTPEALRDTIAADRLKQLEPLSSRLARGIVNEEAKAVLNDLATLTENSAVIVQLLRIKTGPGGSWNAWTGQITSGMSSTTLQTALISCRTGQVLWKNESVARKVYRADDLNFAKWLATVYQTLERQSN